MIEIHIFRQRAVCVHVIQFLIFPPNGQGRIPLPNQLREYARVENDAVITGANTYFEIWNKDQWSEEKTISQEQAWQIIESLEHR